MRQIPALRSLLAACSGSMLLLAGCSESAPPAASQAELRLPVSINEVMVSLINHAADPIWVAAWRNPETDEDWRELEHLSRQLQMGGALLTIPGTGPRDDEWTNQGAWVAFAEQLSAAGGRAINAARSRDVELISRSGDEIVEICEACHVAFKPDLPTMNIFGDLSPLPSDQN